VLRGELALQGMDPGGIDVFSSDLDSFRDALTAEHRTLKRALTDPRIVSGIGNAYSSQYHSVTTASIRMGSCSDEACVVGSHPVPTL